MTFCNEHDGGCGASLSTTDYAAGFCTQCGRQLSTKEITVMKPRRWRRVRMSEIKEVQENLQQRGIWYNGCTGHELTIRYGGDALKHIAGHGWYKLTAS